jgi:hypothetical protein
MFNAKFDESRYVELDTLMSNFFSSPTLVF